MKICPHCQTTYTDETLQFCLQDGTPLVNQAPSKKWTNAETLVSPGLGWEESQVTRIAPPRPEEKKSNTGLAVLLTALGMLFLFGIVGVGAWIYFKSKDDEIAKNKNATGTPNSNVSGFNNMNSSPSPTASAKPSPQVTFTPTVVPFNSPTPLATPGVDPEQVKSEVSSKVYGWKSALESGSLSAFMSHYADRLDYYFNKSGVSAGAVRADKQRAFELFNSFRVTLTNMRVTTDPAGERATAVFDKEWTFTGAKTNSGKVQSQLELRKIGGQWRIIGERDLKVYYVNAGPR